MPLVRFTSNLTRHVACPEAEVDGETVYAALEAYFARYPDVRGYVLDDQGALRTHMAVFVRSELVRDRDRLSDAVGCDDPIDVIQALSGG